jgi:hypothetical protein
VAIRNGIKNIAGERIASARASHRPPLTQDALSGRLARVGVAIDRASIAKIETNRRYVLDYELRGFAKVLGVETDWLLGSDK